MIYSGSIDILLRFIKKIEEIHSYEIIGFDNILYNGSAIVIFNHPFVAYDILFLMNHYYNKTGKILRGVGDHVAFNTPVLKEFFHSIGVVDGIRENVQKLILDNEKIIVYPGGGREAMKSSSEKYQSFWQGRYGFIEIAIKYNIPIIPIVSIGSEDVFHVFLDGYNFYNRGIPLPIFKINNYKSKITHHIHKPIFMDFDESNKKYSIRRIQRELLKIFKLTINKEVKYG